MDFILAILLGIVASLIAQLIWSLYSSKAPVLRKPPDFSLSGIYATRLSSTIVDGEFVEIVKIRQKGDKINFYMENYNSNRSSVWRYGGSGYYRAPQLAITYFPLDKAKPNIGVFSLRNTSTPNGELFLAGIFAQLIDFPDQELQTISQRYFLKKVDIPLKKQINILFQKPYFKNYNELKSYMDLKATWERLSYRPKDKCKIVHMDE